MIKHIFKLCVCELRRILLFVPEDQVMTSRGWLVNVVDDNAIPVKPKIIILSKDELTLVSTVDHNVNVMWGSCERE